MPEPRWPGPVGSASLEGGVDPAVSSGVLFDWRRPFRWIAGFFILYPIMAIASSRPDPLEVALGVAATVIFAGLVWVGWRLPMGDARRASWWGTAGVLAILAIAVALVWTGHDSWIAFFYFASAGASPLLPERRTLILIASAGIAAWVTLLALGSSLGPALLQGISVTAMGLLIFSVNETRRVNRALLQARQDLARMAVAEERSRIARDLHDTLGHSLSLIALKSELAGRLLPDDPVRAKAEVADVERVARESLSAVRETVGGYRRPSLAAELAAARTVLKAADLAVDIEAPEEPLPAAADEALAWALREAVTNVVRHSRATQVTIRVGRSPGRATIEVVDDGKAPSEEPTRTGRGSAGTGSGGHGLVGLRERLAGEGGELEAGAVDGGGYRLRAAVPIAGGSAA